MTKIGEIINYEDEFKFITGKDLNHNKNSEVTSVGYIDDINHIISNKNKEELERITDDKHKLVVEIYNINVLKVKNDKTQILQVEKTCQALLSKTGKV